MAGAFDEKIARKRQKPMHFWQFMPQKLPEQLWNQ
jgi:hypothetical protein